MSICLYVCLGTMFGLRTHGQKKASDLLKVEVQIVSHNMYAGN